MSHTNTKKEKVDFSNKKDLSKIVISEKPKKRILYITFLSILIAIGISVIAYFLMKLIAIINNFSFFGLFSSEYISPADNTLGFYVILVPIFGSLIIGLMIHYGSKDIRGHGIPEAMAQILTNKSKIKPIITYLKPLASAITIGTGGPFGAEGPIIATGGALGSTLGQITKVSANERKILLASGAAAGMSAIFGTPIAAILLSIELLLFEFSPRSLISVSLACLVGDLGHRFFFDSGPFFRMISFSSPNYQGLFLYLILGLFMGAISILVSKSIYFIEDIFEKLPLNLVWYPAIGAIAVGIVGYFAPNTLGVGYENISILLNNKGDIALPVILSLCILKYISWSIALGSGTAGGTLAPLLIIGGASGSLIATVFIYYFPHAQINLALSALLGMSAMFAGASRAVLTSIIFALETTEQANALVPLSIACFTSYSVSYILTETTIMTEKIARRGIIVPDTYASDSLKNQNVNQYIDQNIFALDINITASEAKEWLNKHSEYKSAFLIATNELGEFKGLININALYKIQSEHPIQNLISFQNLYITKQESLRTALHIMADNNLDILPIINEKSHSNLLEGIIHYRDILQCFKVDSEQHVIQNPSISIRKKGLKILLRGKKLWNTTNLFNKKNM